jgi:hypothetical protein
MSLVVRAFPVLEGKEEEIRRFAEELAGARRAEASSFYRSFGVRRESWHLQQTPNGTIVIGVTEVDEPETRAPEYAQSQRGFDLWFKESVRRLTGIDPETEPLGPPTETLFEFSGEAAPDLDSTRDH